MMTTFLLLNGSLSSAPALVYPLWLSLDRAQQCVCNAFSYDTCGDHLQTFQTKSGASQVHDRVVYKLGAILGSSGHIVKIHKITSATGKERGDIEIKDCGLAKTSNSG
jgi:hypothetical protein